jgi:hypothetical protein
VHHPYPQAPRCTILTPQPAMRYSILTPSSYEVHYSHFLIVSRYNTILTPGNYEVHHLHLQAALRYTSLISGQLKYTILTPRLLRGTLSSSSGSLEVQNPYPLAARYTILTPRQLRGTQFSPSGICEVHHPHLQAAYKDTILTLRQLTGTLNSPLLSPPENTPYLLQAAKRCAILTPGLLRGAPSSPLGCYKVHHPHP